MFESITHFLKRFRKSEKLESKSTAKERLHLVLAQDRANISADFLEMMKQEILEVIKKYIDIDEKAIDVRLTNKESEDGSIGAPALYANIPIITIKNEARKLEKENKESENHNDKLQDKGNFEDAGKNKESDLIKVEKESEDNKEREKKSINEEENISSDDTLESEDNHKVENEDVKTDKVKLENNNVDEVDNEEKNS